MKNLQRGFAPMLIIAIIAILAIGGGAYYMSKNKKASVEDNPNTQANANADANANENANLGASANKNSLRSLLALGKNTKCTFATVQDGISSSGTFYLAANGNMSGEFETKIDGATTTSNMIVKNGFSYAWNGTQGAKMKIPEASANAGAQANKNFEQFDAQMDYNCSPWVLDESKFTPPAGVNFMDLDAFMKGGANIPIPKY